MVHDSKMCEMTKGVINTEDASADYMMMDNTVLPTGCIGSMWKEGSLPIGLGATSSRVVVPEGRVHGGGLIALLSGSSEQMLNVNNNFVVGHPSEPGKFYMMPRKWV